VAPWSSIGNSQGGRTSQEPWDLETTIVVVLFDFFDLIDSG